MNMLILGIQVSCKLVYIKVSQIDSAWEGFLIQSPQESRIIVLSGTLHPAGTRRISVCILLLKKCQNCFRHLSTAKIFLVDSLCSLWTFGFFNQIASRTLKEKKWMLLMKAFACSYIIELKHTQSFSYFWLPAGLFYHPKGNPAILCRHSGKPITKGMLYFFKLSCGKAEAFSD